MQIAPPAMLDEPSLGLAPIVIEQVFDRIVELNRRTVPAGRPAPRSAGANLSRPAVMGHRNRGCK
jgi:hypothetical protein